MDCATTLARPKGSTSRAPEMSPHSPFWRSRIQDPRKLEPRTRQSTIGPLPILRRHVHKSLTPLFLGYNSGTLRRGRSSERHDVAYGYRIFKVSFTPSRKLTPELRLDNPLFGPDGAVGTLADICRTLSTATGDTDSKKGAYFRVVDSDHAGWVIAVRGSGGSFGVEREVVDTTTDQPKSKITTDDAVLERMLMLFVLPPNGNCGLLIAETSGRSHLTPGLVKVLNMHLQQLGVRMRLEDDFTDGEAWGQFLSKSTVDVQALELVQTHKPAQGVSFGDNSIARAVISLQLAPGTQAKSTLLKELKKAFTKGKKPKLTGLIGLNVAHDSDFDEQRVVYVENGRKRRITVASTWPVFIYALGDEAPSLQELLDECRREVQHLLNELQIGRPANWWPSHGGMKQL